MKRQIKKWWSTIPQILTKRKGFSMTLHCFFFICVYCCLLRLSVFVIRGSSKDIVPITTDRYWLRSDISHSLFVGHQTRWAITGSREPLVLFVCIVVYQDCQSLYIVGQPVLITIRYTPLVIRGSSRDIVPITTDVVSSYLDQGCDKVGQ